MNQQNDVPVVIIEDEPEIRKFLKAVLTVHGYSPSFAENAKEGLKLLTLHPPELIILDLGLPDMDGIAVIKHIREWSNIPIIVLSARGREQDKVEALELGADDYLTKPFNSAELLARLRVALRHAHQSQQNMASVYEAERLRIDLEKRQVSVDN